MLQVTNSAFETSWPAAGMVPYASPTETRKPEMAARLDARIPVKAATDVALRYAEAVAASSDEFGWENLRVLHLRHELNEMVLPASDQHLMIVNFSASMELYATLDKQQFHGAVGPGEVAIIPAGSTGVCVFNASHARNALFIYLRPLFVRKAVEECDFSFHDLSLVPQIGFESRHIRHIGRSLLSELTEASVVGRLYADSLAVGLAMQLVRRYSSLRDVPVGRGGLAPHRLRKAIGLIDHHLAEEEEGRVGLRFVAQEVGMSYFHFSRAFKQAMGMTLTNYIAERRIELAKKLMKETDLPISEIALRTGFSSQSHFTTSFRRVARITPRSFRQGI